MFWMVVCLIQSEEFILNAERTPAELLNTRTHHNIANLRFGHNL